MRNNSDAQPKKKLTRAGWEALYQQYLKRTDVSVAALCKAKNVSKARFYAKFGARIAEAKKTASAAPTTDSPRP